MILNDRILINKLFEIKIIRFVISKLRCNERQIIEIIQSLFYICFKH